MKYYVKVRKECAERVVLFGNQAEITKTPLETTIFGNLSTKLTTMQNWGVDQVSGQLAFRDGAQDRKTTATNIRLKLRSISEMAKSLELAGTPGITAIAFRVPKQRSYEVLSAAATAFAENAEPQKTKFIELGMAATFVEDLEALVTQLNADYQERENGRFERTGGTAGLEALADDCLKLVQRLRPIMREHLKDNPGLLGAWNLAARVEHSRSKKAEVPGDPGSGESGGGTPPVGS
jgi:hypothetical protein